MGIGPGGEEQITPEARVAIQGAAVLVGGRRLLDLFPAFPGETKVIDRDLDGVLAFIRERAGEKIAVLASGDPGFYGILDFLRRHFPPERLRVIPGISSIQGAFAKVALPWWQARLVSIHGRDLKIAVTQAAGAKLLGILGDPRVPAGKVAKSLLDAGRRGRVSVVWEIGSAGEELFQGTLEEAVALGRGDNYVLVYEEEEP